MHESDIPEPFLRAIYELRRRSEGRLRAEQDQNKVEQALYHYTDARGLQGIIESGRIWFTDYRHLNDPSELIHGINMAHDAAHLLMNGADKRVCLFLKNLIDMFSHGNFSRTLQFFIASFSRDGNDLGQWRSYADNGRGFSIGFRTSMFEVVETLPTDAPREFVGPIIYDIDRVRERHRLPLAEAASIFLEVVNANADLAKDKEFGLPFMQDMAREVIASPLIWNCLTSKHPAYKLEQEVRLVILGQLEQLLPYISTRLRGSEIVPYVAHSMPVRDSICEIVIGPAAPSDAERTVRVLLASLGVDPANIPIRRSDIPYRAL